ncbi:tetratricopeptide repeat protein [Roseospira navarrensis]|uniref:Tetratricopeptide repeat protein n=1 Tax=Roseospira navarrensis TaxID=140058 RepID=A0A7X2D4X1_9PROT|nr:tetratricopeptide repeat protein [Roseospira navarrensis]MQX38363.1 tetratricopeptide repeat protein [Roseospira navarrensis]
MTGLHRSTTSGLRLSRRRPTARTALRALVVAGLLLGGLGGVAPALAAPEVVATAHDGYGRMVFRWDDPVRYTVEIQSGNLVAEFDAPVPADVALVPSRLDAYVDTVRVSGDRRTVTLPLKDDFRLKVFTLGGGVVIDLLGGPELAAPAPTPRDTTDSAPAPATSAPAAVRVRTGNHDTFQRIVFDWPRSVGHEMTRDGTRLTLRFDQPARLGVDAILSDLPDGFTDLGTQSGDGSSVFQMTVPEGANARTFESGPKVVLDVTLPDDPPAPAVPPQDSAEAPAQAAPEAEAEAEPETEAETGAETAPREETPPPGADAADTDAPVDTGLAPDEREIPVDAPATEPATEPEPEPGAAPEDTAPQTNTDPADTSDVMPEERPEVLPAALTDAPDDGGAPEDGGAPDDSAMTEDAGDGAEDVAPPSPPTSGSFVSLGFPWDQPTAGAVFRRAGYLWVVFDRFQEVDLDLLRRSGRGVVRTIEQVRVGPNSTLVRMTTAPGYNPSLRRDGLLWVVDLMQQPLRPERPIEVEPQLQSPVGSRLLLPVVEGGRVVPVRDPELGDQFFVLPLIQLGHGVYPARSFPEVTLPVTAQGVVVIPHSDRIEMRSSRSGAEIAAADGGLTLSEEDTRLQTLSTLGEGALKQIFDVPGWRREDDTMSFHEVLQDLQYAVAVAPESRRGQARLELARYYFANGYAPEALGVLRAIGEEQVEMVNTAAFRALRGATNFLMHRNGEAVDDLGHPSLIDVDEAAFWRAAAQSRLGHAGLQASVLEATGGVLETYPPDLRIPLSLVAAEAAIEAGDDLAANTFLEAARDPEFNTTHDEAAIKYLEGNLLASTGAFEAAMAAWREAEIGQSRFHAARATKARLDMEYDLDLIGADELIAGLEGLRFAWRGGDFEYDLLRELGDLYLQEGRYGDSLRNLRLAASYFQERPGVEELTETMRQVFDTLFLDGAANDMPPLKAIALFDEFRELTPTGNKGDEMIRRLADRLVSVDLLDPAAGLLERQIRYRLRGLERTRVGARLALVYLLNRQPGNALEALDKTRFAPLPERLERQRRHLRARALADTDDVPAAIALLENDSSEDARVLRAEIHWRDRNWAQAAQALAELVPAPPPGDAELPEKDAFRLIDWATALTLAGDETAVSLLRERYFDVLEGTPFQDAFDLVTATPEAGLIDIGSVGGKIRQAEKFRSYLTAYRDRLREDRLSAIN